MEVDSQEYIAEINKRRYEGGVLWFIERTDTHEFLNFNVGVFDSDHSNNSQNLINWSSLVGVFPMTHAYLTIEDAKENIPELTEGGCRHCGNGSKKIPMVVTEHEFVTPL